VERHRTSVADDTPRAADRPPRSWDHLAEQYPAVVAAYDALSDVCREAGPLDPATVALVKLAVSVGRGSQRTVHAHARKALRAGADPDALRQVALVALPTIGLPAALDALRWLDDSIREARL
jgi:AhpD family alkylhydroperoxidase